MDRPLIAMVGAALSIAVAAVVAITASAHALLNKRDVRAAIGWVGIIWLVPIVGGLLYLLLGINRIQRRALKLKADAPRFLIPPTVEPLSTPNMCDALPDQVQHMAELARVVDQVTPRPLLPGNRLEPLVGGDDAYSAMLRAISDARRTISLQSYIFELDAAGERFAEALIRAAERGVAVRVLVDGAGVGFARRAVDHLLRHHGIPAAQFLPSLFRRARYANLRNHRKIMVIDGLTGFSGGMNISAGNLASEEPREPISDVHFKIDGPVVAHLQEVFAEDWAFTTGEALQGEGWFPTIEAVGDTLARGIGDGPDEDLDRARWTLLGALACARRRVRIVTPYFLPDQALLTALRVAVLRGVRVEVLIPERSDIRLIDWASQAQLRHVIDYGCSVWRGPPPFDHSKLTVVDGHWLFIGSANWDPRSLRLNFEFNIECYHREIARQVGDIIDRKLERAQRLTLEQLASLPLAVRLRDGAARLLSPYL